MNSKGKMNKRLYLYLLPLLFSLTGCNISATWQKTTLLYFDTLCEVNLFCPPSAFKAALKETKNIFSLIEGNFSPGVQDYSSSMTLDLFKTAAEVNRSSSGSFDITVAPLSQLWGFKSGKHRVPSSEEILSVLKRTGMKKVRINKGTLMLTAGMELDWGGIAKGYGVDLAAQKLKDMGISKGFINAGGDLCCWGKNPEGKPWQVGIKHPRGAGFVEIIHLSDKSAATTGDYQRYFIKKGIRYHHVFDPYTGYPSQGKQSVTVIGPETCLCDALSTALFVSKTPEKILKKYPEYGAILIDVKGEISTLGKVFL
jgi:thiamine biosynthesis lipoprotein